MRKNDLADVKKMDVAALKQRAKDAQKELQGLVLDKSVGKLTDKTVLRKKRTDIAQILTVLRQKQILAELEKGEKNAN